MLGSDHAGGRRDSMRAQMRSATVLASGIALLAVLAVPVLAADVFLANVWLAGPSVETNLDVDSLYVGVVGEPFQAHINYQIGWAEAIMPPGGVGAGHFEMHTPAIQHPEYRLWCLRYPVLPI